jgi:hypothetical protein
MDTVRRVDYYYTTAPDKPGEGARVLAVFRDAGINLLAFHAFPSARRTQLDFVPQDGAAFVAVAKAAKISSASRRPSSISRGTTGSARWRDPGRPPRGNHPPRRKLSARPAAGSAGCSVEPRDVKKAAQALGRPDHSARRDHVEDSRSPPLAYT